MLVKAKPLSTPGAGACSPSAPVPCSVAPAPSPSCCTPGAPGPAGPAGIAGLPGPTVVVDNCCAADTALLAAINSKVADLNRLTEALTILQTISLTLQGLDIPEAADLSEIIARLNTQITSLTAIISALSVLHSDNLVQEAKFDVLHADNLVVEGKLDAVNANLVGIDQSVSTFNGSFDEVKLVSDGRWMLKVQLADSDVLENILNVLRNIETQMSFVTDETLEKV